MPNTISNSLDTLHSSLLSHSIDKLTNELIKQNLEDNSAKIAIISTLIGGGLVLLGSNILVYNSKHLKAF